MLRCFFLLLLCGCFGSENTTNTGDSTGKQGSNASTLAKPNQNGTFDVLDVNGHFNNYIMPAVMPKTVYGFMQRNINGANNYDYSSFAQHHAEALLYDSHGNRRTGAGQTVAIIDSGMLNGANRQYYNSADTRLLAQNVTTDVNVNNAFDGNGNPTTDNTQQEFYLEVPNGTPGALQSTNFPNIYLAKSVAQLSAGNLQEDISPILINYERYDANNQKQSVQLPGGGVAKILDDHGVKSAAIIKAGSFQDKGITYESIAPNARLMFFRVPYISSGTFLLSRSATSPGFVQSSYTVEQKALLTTYVHADGTVSPLNSSGLSESIVTAASKGACAVSIPRDAMEESVYNIDAIGRAYPETVIVLCGENKSYQSVTTPADMSSKYYDASSNGQSYHPINVVHIVSYRYINGVLTPASALPGAALGNFSFAMVGTAGVSGCVAEFAGYIALLKQALPNYNMSQIVSILRAISEDKGKPKDAVGWGFPNFVKLVDPNLTPRSIKGQSSQFEVCDSDFIRLTSAVGIGSGLQFGSTTFLGIELQEKLEKYLVRMSKADLAYSMRTSSVNIGGISCMFSLPFKDLYYTNMSKQHIGFLSSMKFSNDIGLRLFANNSINSIPFAQNVSMGCSVSYGCTDFSSALVNDQTGTMYAICQHIKMGDIFAIDLQLSYLHESDALLGCVGSKVFNLAKRADSVMVGYDFNMRLSERWSLASVFNIGRTYVLNDEQSLFSSARGICLSDVGLGVSYNSDIGKFSVGSKLPLSVTRGSAMFANNKFDLSSQEGLTHSFSLERSINSNLTVKTALALNRHHNVFKITLRYV